MSDEPDVPLGGARSDSPEGDVNAERSRAEPPVAVSAAAQTRQPQLDEPSAEVEHPVGTARLPGAARGYTKFPTGPVGIEPVITSGPDADNVGAPMWVPSGAETGAATSAQSVADNARLAPWALLAAIVALVASFFVGWGIPLAIVAVIAAIMSLRRPMESRAVARWALVLGLAATIYSLGWLIWAAMQFEIIG